MDYVERIAKIEDTFLGIEDYGIFTFGLTLNYGDSSQGCGYLSLGSANILRAVIEACGVDRWEKVKGRTVMALLDNDGLGGTVKGIKPLPTERGEQVVFSEFVKR